jgi:hypothetical protein
MMANEGNADDDDVARRLREIRERLEAGTPGRWYQQGKRNTLIAHAITDLAWLLGEVEKQREEITRLRADRSGRPTFARRIKKSLMSAEREREGK